MKEFLPKIGSVSGAASILGSWQICHNVCLGLAVLLGAVGITITGFPLLFLVTWGPYLWTAAVGLWAVTLYLYFKKKCVSKNLLIFNTGLLIAGFPFIPFEGVEPFFWVAGGVTSGVAVLAYIDGRFARRRQSGTGGHCAVSPAEGTGEKNSENKTKENCHEQ